MDNILALNGYDIRYGNTGFGFTTTNPIWDGLSAYYKFNEGTGTAINDSVGNAHGSTNTTWPSGKSGTCIYVNKTTKGSIPDNTGIKLTTGSFSISVWIYPTGEPWNNGGFIYDKASYPYNYRLNYIITTHKLEFGAAYNGTFDVITTDDAYSFNNWYNVVCTYESGVGKKLYVNGTLKKSGNNNGTLYDDTTGLYIGNYSANNNYGFLGNIDELGIWKRLLSQDEITSLYNSGNGLFY